MLGDLLYSLTILWFPFHTRLLQVCLLPSFSKHSSGRSWYTLVSVPTPGALAEPTRQSGQQKDLLAWQVGGWVLTRSLSMAGFAPVPTQLHFQDECWFQPPQAPSPSLSHRLSSSPRVMNSEAFRSPASQVNEWSRLGRSVRTVRSGALFEWQPLLTPPFTHIPF